MGLTACKSPGFVAPDGDPDVVWSCLSSVFGFKQFHVPGLPEGKICGNEGEITGETGVPGGRYQYQRGPVEPSTVRLPPGIGYPMGGNTGLRSLTFFTHYSYGTPDNMTADSAITIRLLRHKHNMTAAGIAIMEAVGVVGPHSVGWVEGDITIREDVELHLLTIYTHWHKRVIAVSCSIVTPDGNITLFHDPAPRDFQGTADISPLNLTVRQGDKIRTRCTYDNSDNSDPLLVM